MISFPTCTHKAGRISGLCCLAVVMMAGSLFMASPADAQSTRDLTNRIKRLENEIQTLNKAVYRGETPPPPPPSFSGGVANPAAGEVRLQQLETELRDLTGQIEEQNFKIQKLETQMQRFTNDMNLRMQDIESGRSGGASIPSPGAITPPANGTGGDNYLWNSGNGTNGANNPVEINPNIAGPNAATPDAAVLYNRAFSLLKQEKYANSETLFASFLEQHPKHTLAGNAMYWLGETHYVRGQFDRSARIFAEAYQKYPESAKAPDNVLKLGMSLAGAGKKDEACIALRQVEVEHSDAGPVLSRAKQELSKLGC